MLGVVHDPTIVGPYLILDYLGEGGASAVYLARKGDDGIPVALKAVHVQDASRNDQDQVRREIQIMERLKHANVIRLQDAGYDGEWLYYVMEHCPEGSVDEFVQLHRPSYGEVIEILRGISRGVAYIHEQSVIHRDLKPANVLLSPDQTPKLSDFGIAKLPDDPPDPEGVRIGTPRYMAPEVREKNLVSTASDVFQLGLIFYRLITGVEFHKAHKTSGLPKGTTAKNFLAPSRFNASSNDEMDNLILSCLNPEPEARPSPTSAIVEILESIG